MTSWCKVCNEIEVTRHSSLGVCNNCYEFFRYWKKKTLKQMLVRADNLKTYSTRMAFLTGSRGTNEPR